MLKGRIPSEVGAVGVTQERRPRVYAASAMTCWVDTHVQASSKCVQLPGPNCKGNLRRVSGNKRG